MSTTSLTMSKMNIFNTLCLSIAALISLGMIVNCSTIRTNEEQDKTDDVSRVLLLLQHQVKTLQRARLQDQAIIRRLKHSQHKDESAILESSEVNNDDVSPSSEDTMKYLELERDSLTQLQSQISDLKQHLSEMVNNKEREHRAWVTIGELRGEQESLRAEVTKLKKEFHERPFILDEDDSNALKHFKTTQVATKWLQKTVEELRSEMSELAQSVNVSAAYRQNQIVENNLTFVHSDLRSVRSEMEELRAMETKHEAQLEQLKQEVVDMGSIIRVNSKKHDDIANEVRSIQNDISDQSSKEHHQPAEFETRKAHLKPIIDELVNDDQDGSGEGGDETHVTDSTYDLEQDVHRSRHRRRLKLEMLELRRSVTSCQGRQKRVERDLKTVVQAFRSINHTLTSVQGDLSVVKNSSRNDSSDLRGYVHDLSERVTSAEERLKSNSKFLSNVNETASTINMLHDSSVKLFRAVEAVEEEYGKTISDMRKEVSKCDFNLAQLQSSNKVLREDLITQEEKQRILTRQLEVIRGEVDRDHYRLLALQNEALNRSLTECKQRNENAINSLKLSNLEYSVSQIESRFLDHQNKLKEVEADLASKVGTSEGQQWIKAQQYTNDTILVLTRRVLELQNDSRLLNKYLNMIAGRLPRDCSMDGAMEIAKNYSSGVYLIHPVKGTPTFVEVACEISSANPKDSWTIIQRRFDGSEDFYRTWEEYRHGFGQATGEYWLGNELLHSMTSNHNYTLRIDMWDTWGHYKYAEYAHFQVSSEEDNYRLSIGGYRGNSSNAMEYHSQMGFSTRDRDNDASSTHCAVYYSSGWWYNHCQYVNINGKYNIGLTWYDIDSHEWVQLTKVEMKIRPGHHNH